MRLREDCSAASRSRKALGCFLVLLHDASSVQRGTVLAVCYASLSRAAEPWLGHFDTEP